MSAAVIAVGAETPRTAAAINALQARGVPVITVMSDIRSSQRAAHVGQDNFAAGKTAGRLRSSMVPRGTGTIGVLIGHVEFKHLLERQSGFLQSLALNRPDVRLLQTRPYGGADKDSQNVVCELFDQTPDLKGVYLSGGGQPNLSDALALRRSPEHVIIGHETNPISRAALRSGTFQALVSHDTRDVARIAIEAAIAHTQGAASASPAVHAPIRFWMREIPPHKTGKIRKRTPTHGLHPHTH